MAIWVENSYVTVWDVQADEKKVRAQVSSSSKSTEGQWVQDFSDYLTFIGDAKEAAAKLQRRDRIKINKCKVTNTYDREKKRTYYNFTVLDFELADNAGQSKSQTKPKAVAAEDPDEDPFG